MLRCIRPTTRSNADGTDSSPITNSIVCCLSSTFLLSASRNSYFTGKLKFNFFCKCKIHFLLTFNNSMFIRQTTITCFFYSFHQPVLKREKNHQISSNDVKHFFFSYDLLFSKLTSFRSSQPSISISNINVDCGGIILPSGE